MFDSQPVRKELTSVFRTLWTRASQSRPVHVYRVPDACADLVWSEGTIYVCGPRLSPAAVTFPYGTPLVGLRFNPGAAAKWLGAVATEIIDVCVPLEMFGKQRADDLARAVGNAVDTPTVATRLEEALIPTLSDSTVLYAPCINTVLTLAEREHGNGGFVGALRRAYDISERSVRREITRVFGHGPKTLERIYRVQRFLRLARSARPMKLASLASASGFSDQAHMTRELQALAGVTPSEALRNCHSLAVSFKTSREA